MIYFPGGNFPRNLESRFRKCHLILSFKLLLQLIIVHACRHSGFEFWKREFESVATSKKVCKSICTWLYTRLTLSSEKLQHWFYILLLVSIKACKDVVNALTGSSGSGGCSMTMSSTWNSAIILQKSLIVDGMGSCVAKYWFCCFTPST